MTKLSERVSGFRFMLMRLVYRFGYAVTSKKIISPLI